MTGRNGMSVFWLSNYQVPQNPSGSCRSLAFSLYKAHMAHAVNH
jgi:hypothetical protein